MEAGIKREMKRLLKRCLGLAVIMSMKKERSVLLLNMLRYQIQKEYSFPNFQGGAHFIEFSGWNGFRKINNAVDYL